MVSTRSCDSLRRVRKNNIKSKMTHQLESKPVVVVENMFGSEVKDKHKSSHKHNRCDEILKSSDEVLKSSDEVLKSSDGVLKSYQNAQNGVSRNLLESFSQEENVVLKLIRRNQLVRSLNENNSSLTNRRLLRPRNNYSIRAQNNTNVQVKRRQRYQGANESNNALRSRIHEIGRNSSLKPQTVFPRAVRKHAEIPRIEDTVIRRNGRLRIEDSEIRRRPEWRRIEDSEIRRRPKRPLSKDFEIRTCPERAWATDFEIRRHPGNPRTKDIELRRPRRPVVKDTVISRRSRPRIEDCEISRRPGRPRIDIEIKRRTGRPRIGKNVITKYPQRRRLEDNEIRRRPGRCRTKSVEIRTRTTDIEIRRRQVNVERRLPGRSRTKSVEIRTRPKRTPLTTDIEIRRHPGNPRTKSVEIRRSERPRTDDAEIRRPGRPRTANNEISRPDRPRKTERIEVRRQFPRQSLRRRQVKVESGFTLQRNETESRHNRLRSARNKQLKAFGRNASLVDRVRRNAVLRQRKKQITTREKYLKKKARNKDVLRKELAQVEVKRNDDSLKPRRKLITKRRLRRLPIKDERKAKRSTSSEPQVDLISTKLPRRSLPNVNGNLKREVPSRRQSELKTKPIPQRSIISELVQMKNKQSFRQRNKGRLQKNQNKDGERNNECATGNDNVTELKKRRIQRLLANLHVDAREKLFARNKYHCGAKKYPFRVHPSTRRKVESASQPTTTTENQSLKNEATVKRKDGKDKVLTKLKHSSVPPKKADEDTRKMQEELAFQLQEAALAFQSDDVDFSFLRPPPEVRPSKYTCQKCEKTFVYKLRYMTHMETHESSRQEDHMVPLSTFETNKCNVSFSDCDISYSEPVSDAKDSPGENSTIVHNTYTRYTDPDTDVNPLMCQLCFLTLATKTELKDHVNSHFEQFSYIDCNDSFLTESSLNDQNCTATSENSFLEISQTSFNQSAVTQQKYSCDFCGQFFMSKSSLNRHKTDVCRTTKSPKCPTCGLEFVDHANLALHEKWHAGIKPHVCDVCFKTFSTRSHLARHYLSHTDEQKFVCDICERAFYRNDYLQKHKISHAKSGRELQCVLCYKSFSGIEKLKEHVRQHTEEGF